MPIRKHRYHPAAVDEAEAARDWYAAQDLQAAADFLFELDIALADVFEHPGRWPTYLEGTRRHLLERFPFSVVYRKTGELVEIIAIAHGSREPRYWRSRLR